MKNSLKLKLTDQTFMRRCLKLARRGGERVRPNPMVGAVVVKGSRIVGEGYHKMFGSIHAEVVALKNAGLQAEGATLYINLEPCNHLGNTPPCTYEIIKSKIHRVVYAVEDPNPLVKGGGGKYLRRKGIQVESGLLREEAIELNEKFLFAMRTKIPYVIIKSAQTLDGYIADSHHRSQWVSSDESRKLVQKTRRSADAILVGAETIIRDNPRLTIHNEKTNQPYRIILDGNFRTPLSATVFNDDFSHKTIVVISSRNSNALRLRQLKSKGVQVITFKAKGNRINISSLLKILWNKSIYSILVEGGGDVFSQFLASELYAQMMVFVAPKLLGGGIPVFSGVDKKLNFSYALENISIKRAGGDIVVVGYSKLRNKTLNN